LVQQCSRWGSFSWQQPLQSVQVSQPQSQLLLQPQLDSAAAQLGAAALQLGAAAVLQLGAAGAAGAGAGALGAAGAAGCAAL
jgi:hypothetical protein